MEYSAQDRADLDAMKDLLQRSLDDLTHAEDGLVTIDEAFRLINRRTAEISDHVQVRRQRDKPLPAGDADLFAGE